MSELTLPNVELSMDEDQGYEDFRPTMEELASILKMCLLSRRVCAAASDRIDEMDLFRRNKHWFAEVWETLKEHIKQYHRPPSDVDSIVAALRRRRNSGQYYDYLIEDVRKRIVRWLAQRKDVTFEIETDTLARIDDIFYEYMKRKILDTASLSLQGEYTPDDLRARMVEASEKMNMRTATYCEPRNPWREMAAGASVKDLTKDTKRFSCGVAPLDDLTGGGPLPGEMITAIMPSKTGKTTLGLQLTREAVEAGQYVLYHSSEQSLEGDMCLRMFVHVYERDRGFWKDNEADEALSSLKANLNARAQRGDAQASIDLNKIREREARWSKYLDFHDEWRRPDGPRFKGVSDLFDPVFRRAREKDENGNPIHYRYMVIDWWRLFKDQYCDSGATDSQMVSKARQSRLLSDIKAYTEEAVRQGIPLTTIIFNQTSGVVAEKSSGSGPTKNSSHSAQGDKDFNNLFDFATSASGRWSTKSSPGIVRVTFNHETGRSAAGGVKDYRLKGEWGLFEALSDDEADTSTHSADDKKTAKARSGGGVPDRRRSNQL